CRDALRQFLLITSVPERDRTSEPTANDRSFFAFKLHQFISGAGHAFATLEPPGSRSVIVDGQKFLPEHPEKRLYPVHFCRECGHEYHPVRLVSEGEERSFLSRDIDDALPAKEDDSQHADDSDGEVFGFLTQHPVNDTEFTFNDRDEQYPENWLD